MLHKISQYFVITFLLLPALSSYGQFKLGVGTNAPKADPISLINYETPKAYVIGGIEVKGVKFLDPNTLISVSGLSVGSQIDIPGEAISSAVRRLMDQGIIEEVSVNVTKIEDNKAFLEIELKERPRLNKIVLTGIKDGEKEDIDKLISENRGKVITEALVKNIQLKIKRHFVDKGFSHAAVQVKQIDDSIRLNNATLQFNISKKHKVKINQIHVAGIEEVQEWKLLAKMKKQKPVPLCVCFRLRNTFPKNTRKINWL